MTGEHPAHDDAHDEPDRADQLVGGGAVRDVRVQVPRQP